MKTVHLTLYHYNSPFSCKNIEIAVNVGIFISDGLCLGQSPINDPIFFSRAHCAFVLEGGLCNVEFLPSLLCFVSFSQACNNGRFSGC